MISQLALDETFIVSIWLEVLLYGLYMALFCSSVYIVLHRRNLNTLPSKVMFGSMLLMFLLATLHVGINLYRLLMGYVWLRDAPGGPPAYFGDLARWDQVFKDTVFATQSIVGDALSIYRCWIVWENNYWVIILPIMLLTGSTVSGYVVAWIFTTDQSSSIFSARLHDWIITFYILAMVQKMMTTCLVAYHIWRHDRAIAAVNGRSSLMPIVRIVFESAALYVAAELVLITLYALGHNAQYILVESITPTVGIVFTSITVRLALRNRNYGGISDPGPSTRATLNFATMPPVTVHITQSITHSVQQKDEEDEAESFAALPEHR